MLRKRVNRRKPQSRTRRKVSLLRLPKIKWGIIANFFILGGMLGATYFGTLWLMDRPINAVRIEGSFERVSAVQVEAAMAPYLEQGFLSLNLNDVQNAIAALPWVEAASIRRSWPAALNVALVEERAAARWNQQGLLNLRGELFVASASHIPAELPWLNGPAGSELGVAQRFFAMEAELQQRGLTAVELTLDERGSWVLGLSNGIRVRFGAVSVDERAVRFFRAFDRLLQPLIEQINYVDMRYTNGFAIGWKSPAKTRLADNGETRPNA
jgi:cell division protein FtsQ